LLEEPEAVHADRILVPERIELGERLGDALRRGQPPERVELDHDVHPVPDGRADPAERLQ
jgi:hypothetical protein